jgi:hypothetical protein
MLSTATNRTAALAGAWSAVGGVAYSKILSNFGSHNEVALWFVNLAALVVIFFVPFFRWVIGTNFKPSGEGLTFREQWHAEGGKYARLAIWFVSAAAIGTVATLTANAISR